MHALDILGDPARRRILELLADGEQSAGDIVRVLGRERGISQPAVSQHLKVLKEAGLVRGRIDGKNSCYCLDPRGIGELRAALDALLGELSSTALTTAESELEKQA